MTLLDFLRDVGKHASVNQMVARESVKARLESENGISFTEFSYQLLQANDYWHLFRTYGVELQIGGSDQWGNLLAGVDLIRRADGGHVHAFTWPLVLRSDGERLNTRKSKKNLALREARGSKKSHFPLSRRPDAECEANDGYHILKSGMKSGNRPLGRE